MVFEDDIEEMEVEDAFLNDEEESVVENVHDYSIIILGHSHHHATL